MVEYLGLHATGWKGMTENWWNLILSGLVLTSIVVGSVFLLVAIYKQLRKQWLQSRKITKAPRALTKYLEDHKRKEKQIGPRKSNEEKPKTFGVFLGGFDSPPSSEQKSLLSQWDSIVLDPGQEGVLNVLASQRTSAHILGRLDVGSILEAGSSSGNAGMVKSFGVLLQTLATRFQRPYDMQSPFTAVLLADWSAHFPPVIFNELVTYVANLGFDVYLEIAGPAFLTEDECRMIDFSVLRGIVCRNGSILPDGQQRNYFQMLDMRRALRALKVQTVTSGSTVMFWETIDDDAKLKHSVIKRSFTWCKFSSVISWIGPKSALTDAKSAKTKTVSTEPLGAMMWLKEDVKMQDTWRLNEKISKPSRDNSIYDSLEDFLPNLAEDLEFVSSAGFNEGQVQLRAKTIDGFQWLNQGPRQPANPFSFSPHGNDYTAYGCFQLGLDCSAEDFEELRKTQGRLRELGLLKCVPAEELRRIGDQLQSFYNSLTQELCSLDESHALTKLIRLLSTANGDETDCLRVYRGLDSGYRTTIDTKFWGLYDVDYGTGTTDIYISEKTVDVTGTLLHTFMSRMSCTRSQCFMAEMALAKHNASLTEESWSLPPRIIHDIQLLSPTETLLFLQHIANCDCEDDPNFSASVRSCCEYQLLEVPSLTQLRALNSTSYLNGEVSAAELVSSRLAWYREHGYQHPDPASALSLFTDIENRILEVLLNGQSEIISQLDLVLQTILQKGRIDACADFFALSVFCTFRKLALNEVQLEIMDRNPLPNAHSDQAACFAEMFALGSRCENYFDITPNVLGEILSNRIHAYYKANQPPGREDGFTELPTAYSSSQIDQDIEAGPPIVPIIYQVTFIGIFAVPAFIDILLLTTIGRGLYISSYMSETEKTMATTALMMSLLLTGGIGTWVSSGGCYYLHSMAFHAMNMFVLTRFIAGIAIALAGGILSLAGISIVKGGYAGIVFFLYFIIFSMYLTLLATLAIYQYPGYMFQSGRVVIMTRIPILLISPILTLWVGHDVLVYLCVMTGFLVSLFWGARNVVSSWGTWYLSIPTVTDHEVVHWYTKINASKIPVSPLDAFGGEIDLGATPLPRKALLEYVLNEYNRPIWKKSTSDEFVSRLANGYNATKFLMDWYCKYTRTEKPYPFSPTWNLQCKAALATLLDMQKGLKSHNAFIHWRYAGDEVWCGILYFVIALLDKWVALMTGASIVGLSDASNETFRLSVGFGLAYYLVGAVCLDAVANPLWALANKKIAQPISSLAFLRQAEINDAKGKRALYLKNLVKFFCLHIWGLSIFAGLMWIFDNSQNATIMYLSYVFAYTGLLWYQYNRIFAGPAVLKDLIIAVIVGLLTGLLLHRFLPGLAFSNVSALGSATWTAAFLSIWSSKLRVASVKSEAKVNTGPSFYCCSTLDPNPQLSQTALSASFDAICSLPSEWCYRLDPMTYPGVEVMEILKSTNHTSALVRNVLSTGEHLLQQTAELWAKGDIMIDLVPSRIPIQKEHGMRSISQLQRDRLHIFVFIGLDIAGDEWIMDIHRNCKVVAEAVINSTAESLLGFSHDHAALAELLATDDAFMEESVPDGVKRQLETSEAERTKVVRNGDKALLRYLLLGLDCEKDWDHLPKNIRTLLLARCRNESYPVSQDQMNWIKSTCISNSSLGVNEFISRCNLSATLTTNTTSYARTLEAVRTYQDQPELPDSSYDLYFDDFFSPSTPYKNDSIINLIKRPLFNLYIALRLSLKFFVVSLVADPEFQRELDFLMNGKLLFFRWPVTFCLNMVWIYTKALQQLILPLVLFHGREHISKLYGNMKGMKTIMKRNRIIIESLNGPSTCFVEKLPDGSSQVSQYTGNHKQQPEGRKTLKSVNTYSESLFLRRREEYAWESIVNVFEYEYLNETPTQTLRKTRTKLPLQRRCVEGSLKGQIVQYDKSGYIKSGSFIKDDNPIDFKFWYRKNAGFGDELLRAEYVLPFIIVRVFWCIPPASHPEREGKWIPYEKVMQATFIQGDLIYEATWHYDHKFHPVITTILNGEEIPTPPMVEHDWLGILQKPKDFNFISDNPFLSFKSLHTNIFSRMMGLNTRTYPISTSCARTHLWKSWKTGKNIDAVTARWLDEIALRSEHALNKYWRNRDLGCLNAAHRYLDLHTDKIMARVEITPEISAWTPLAFKISDLYSFGQGGDTRINTRTIATQLQDGDDKLNILAMDTGTWPNEGGGVSACRRDMVNNLDSIRWHVIAESANDFGVPKFQIEKNVQSLTILPLWGMDFLTPTHGMFRDHLNAEIQDRSHDTENADIKKIFLPIFTTLVRCSRAIKLEQHHIDEATKAMVDLNTYFESSRHWSDVWMSDVVKQTWRELWLAEDMENTRPISEWLDAERPTITHMDNALDMWQRYLFIFSIPVPEDIPDVFQASHHFAGASYGVVCKIKRNCTLHVWDHCISWREVTVFLSSSMSFDNPFVCTALMSLSRIASVVILHHADVVLPCADFFNPGWEVELGSGQGEFEHRRTFARKIDPVVNGITDIEQFKPIETIKSKLPTVVMLSHVRFVKDIKTAILAADIIVNDWGFTDYRLDIYGDMERAPAYATECQEIIATKSLRTNVCLKGLGSPSKVLEEAWIFLNSSVSEGLPLAMGEAALTGVPVVCTDVGASFRVVTDPITGKRFSAVCPPNDAVSLAKAQISVLALTDEWAEYAEDKDGYRAKLPAHPTREDAARITKRMYEKTEQRRRLGMMGRTNVQNSFSEERYLREHEQMLWIGKYRSQSYRTRTRTRMIGASTMSLDNLEGVGRKKKNGLWYDSVMVEEKSKTPHFSNLSSLPVSSNASFSMAEGSGSQRSSTSAWREMNIPEKAKLKSGGNGKSSLFIEF